MSREDVFRVLATVDGAAVLVGGQAIGWWVGLYRQQGRLMHIPATAAFASKDVDFVGTEDQLRPLASKLAREFGGEIWVPSKRESFTRLLSSRVLFHDGAGQPRELDLLSRMSCADESEVLATAVDFEGRAEDPAVQVINPELLFRTRVELMLTDHEYRTQHAADQAQVACAVLHEWLIDQLDESWQEARKPIRRTLRFLLERVQKARTRFGLELGQAVPTAHTNYPPAFLAEHLPRMLAQMR